MVNVFCKFIHVIVVVLPNYHVMTQGHSITLS